MTDKQKQALKTFIEQLGAEMAGQQLWLLCQGVRDVRLHDSCITLFDAGLFSVQE
jgi:hypothetical protein